MFIVNIVNASLCREGNRKKDTIVDIRTGEGIGAMCLHLDCISFEGNSNTDECTTSEEINIIDHITYVMACHV